MPDAPYLPHFAVITPFCSPHIAARGGPPYPPPSLHHWAESVHVTVNRRNEVTPQLGMAGQRSHHWEPLERCTVNSAMPSYVQIYRKYNGSLFLGDTITYSLVQTFFCRMYRIAMHNKAQRHRRTDRRQYMYDANSGQPIIYCVQYWPARSPKNCSHIPSEHLTQLDDDRGDKSPNDGEMNNSKKAIYFV